MKPIGGFFALNIESNNDPRLDNAVYFNSGRNCLLVILNKVLPEKLYVPRFTCGVLLEAVEKSGVRYEFYSINSNFEPVINAELGKNDFILFTNYYGILSSHIKSLKSKYQGKLILDFAQAYYDEPDFDAPVFYSPRKFFGLPDGGILKCSWSIEENLYHVDKSTERISHLTKRMEGEIEDGYKHFQVNDRKLIGESIKRMSSFTKDLLRLNDTEEKRLKRLENFDFLHSFFYETNRIKLDPSSLNGPLCYPLLLKSGGCEVKEYLIKNKIFTPTYWPEPLDLTLNDFESDLKENLICLPIDFRYSRIEMNYIISTYTRFEK